MRIITTILFDLDQTLYAPGTGLLQAGDCRITDFLAHRLQMPREHADELRQRLWREYGTTARGGEIEFGIPQREMYVDSFEGFDPAQYLCPDEPLARMLEGLDAELYVVTNSAADYAEKVLQALEIDHCFDGVFDIEAMDWCPKPEVSAYACVLAELGRDPVDVAMVEDFPWNLVPAQDLGMFTIYLGQEEVVADLSLMTLLELPKMLAAAGIMLMRPEE